MTLKDEEREILIKYRIDQAYEAMEEARFLIDNDRFKLAVNRIYYGMFYILSSLALKHHFKTSKHKELIGWFNKTFVKNQKIERKYGAIIHGAFENRSDSDYGVMVKFSKEAVEEMFEKMRDFISTIEILIKKQE